MKITPISLSDDYLKQLQVLVEPKGNLRQHGFITKPLTDEELLLKRRCRGCGKSLSQLKGRQRPNAAPATEAPATEAPAVKDAYSAPAPTETPQLRESAKPAPAPQFKCKFHPGEVSYKYWTCCNQHCTADPCSGAHFHDPQDEPLSDLSERYQLHYTPIVIGRHGPQDVRAAVALDCEMGTAENGDSELIKITTIDYFTGEILLDNIVEPDVQLRHLSTRYSGVTWAHMRAAQRNRTALKGTDGARSALWKYVDDQTVVIGHGVSSDLRAMKWIHEQVVDSMVIETKIKKQKEDKEKQAKAEADAKAKAEGTYVEPNKVNETAVPVQKKKRKGGDLSLKGLADTRLGRKIQLGDGKTGHDSLEDAVAARDLVHWHIVNAGAE